jgi:hypothetical protein
MGTKSMICSVKYRKLRDSKTMLPGKGSNKFYNRYKR